MSTSAYPITESTCVRRATHQKKGRNIWLSPASAALRHLHYGRIILDAGDEPVQFATGNQETGLISLRGEAEVAVGEARFTLVPYDSIYIPRDSQVVVKAAAAGCDLAEVSAGVSGTYPLQFIPYQEIKKDPTLHFHAGGKSAERNLNILLGKNVKAGRICAGVTFSEPGNWTSWPPHEHTDMLEEAYLYINMPEPSWGVQFVYNDPRNPELMVVVREGDCVVMPGGYHPNVSAPGGTIGFLWMMAAHREVEDRQFGVVNVQPEYAAGGTGLEASRK